MSTEHVRVYSYQRRWMRVALAPVGGAAAVLVFRMGGDEDVPVLVTVAVGMGFVAFFALLVRLAVYSATIVSERNLTVRGAFRSRVVPWREVQGIEIRHNLDLGTDDGPLRVAVYYDASGRRRDLPYLNDRFWPVTLDDEVAAARETWLRRRGMAWKPVPRVERRIAQDQREAVPPWALAMGVGSFVFVLGIIAFIVLLLTGAYGRGGADTFADTYFPPLVLVAAVPAGTCVLTLLAAVLWRRRDL